MRELFSNILGGNLLINFLFLLIKFAGTEKITEHIIKNREVNKPRSEEKPKIKKIISHRLENLY